MAEIIRVRCNRGETDRKRFVSAAEETFSRIHEGNFARYRVRPAEYESWKALWQ